MKTRNFSLLITGLLLMVYQAAYLQAQDKIPVPADAAQKQAASLIANLFKADYDAAKTPEQKADLAREMFQVGIDSKDDPTGRYVLLRIARDIAADAGDIKTAMASVEQLTGAYGVDGLAIQAEVLARIVKALRLPKDHQELAATLQQAFDAAVLEDRFDLVKTINAVALDSARQARSATLIKQVVAQGKEMEVIEAEYRKVQAAFEKLKTAPTDPEANLLVGRYQCFIKGDWENGLLMLALGSDGSLKELAELELADEPDALNLADSWWKCSEGCDGRSKQTIQVHASGWYRKALPTLTGLSKATAEERLNSVDTTHNSIPEGTENAEARTKGKPTTTVFSFATEKAIKESWTLPSNEKDWQIINGSLQLHGNTSKYFRSNFQLRGDCEIAIQCWNKGWGGPSIHLFGEKLELPGPNTGGPMSYKVYIVRKGGELFAQANDKKFTFQLKDSELDKPTYVGFSYTNHNNSGIRINGLAIVASEIIK